MATCTEAERKWLDTILEYRAQGVTDQELYAQLELEAFLGQNPELASLYEQGVQRVVEFERAVAAQDAVFDRAAAILGDRFKSPHSRCNLFFRRVQIAAAKIRAQEKEGA